MIIHISNFLIHDTFLYYQDFILIFVFHFYIPQAFLPFFFIKSQVQIEMNFLVQVPINNSKTCLSSRLLYNFGYNFHIFYCFGGSLKCKILYDRYNESNQLFRSRWIMCTRHCVFHNQAPKGALAVHTWHISTFHTRNFPRISPKTKHV